MCSSQDVSDQAIVSGSKTADGYGAIPTSSLGMEYVITTYYHNMGWPFGPYDFIILGTKDDTNVAILLRHAEPGNLNISFDGRFYTEGDVITTTLGRFEAIQVLCEIHITFLA